VHLSLKQDEKKAKQLNNKTVVAFFMTGILKLTTFSKFPLHEFYFFERLRVAFSPSWRKCFAFSELLLSRFDNPYWKVGPASSLFLYRLTKKEVEAKSW
jgi:hypothetical protein